MPTLDSWTVAACAELGIDPAGVNVHAVLDLARVVAHQVERPAAPVTAFILGLAVGAGQAADEAADRLLALADSWTESGETLGAET
jgi:Domain of unknown function (DUF6457)